MRLFQIFLTSLMLFSCGQGSRDEMMKGLESCDTDSICVASYYFGEQRDKSVVKQLLTGIEDVRISHHIQHNGMSIYYCKMGALRKISGLDISVRQTDRPDSMKVKQFVDWAATNELIDRDKRIDTRSCVS